MNREQRDRPDPFADVDPAWRHAFTEAWASFVAGSMGIGAVLVDADGEVVARGRNRVLEAHGTGAIAGTFLAHAEMDAFAALGLRTADGLTLYTTIEPCLMCAATSISMRVSHVRFAAADPVFDGLDATLGLHPYCAARTPKRAELAVPELAAVARVLPLAARAWSRPGEPPRPEWLGAHAAAWDAATGAVEEVLPRLVSERASAEDAIRALLPVLDAAGAV